MANSVMGVMAMGAGIEPTPLALQTNVLTITPPRLPDVTTLAMPACPCDSLPESSVQTTTKGNKQTQHPPLPPHLPHLGSTLCVLTSQTRDHINNS